MLGELTKINKIKKINTIDPRKYGVIIVLMLVMVFASLTSDVFFTKANFINILRQVSINGILACGMTFAIISGGFDLSVGSIVSAAGVLSLSLQSGIGVIPSILVALVAGISFGLITGGILSIIKGTIGDAFIITLGMQILIQAFTLLYTGGASLRGSKSEFYNLLGQGFLGPIPMPVVIFASVIAISHFILRKTRFGRQIYCIGGNFVASSLSGINVKLIRILVYVITGVTASLGAIILTSRTLGATPIIGQGYELDAISAVIVGGTSLSGGEGGILRTVLGVLVIGIISNVLNLLGVSVHNQMIVKGLIILVAVWLDKK